jgi:hypothetical protein
MKKKVIRVLLAVIALILIVTVVIYLIYREEKDWLAFYITCCGGMLIVNLILSIIFVNKNIKDKR